MYIHTALSSHCLPALFTSLFLPPCLPLPCSCNVRSPICCVLGYQQQPPHQLHITRARKKAQIRTRRATRPLKFRVTRAHPLISNKTGNHSSTLTSLYRWRAWKLFSKREENKGFLTAYIHHLLSLRYLELQQSIVT